MDYIANLKEGQHVIDFYLCKDKQQLVTKNGKDYLKLQLEDKTGTINGMVWDLNAFIQPFNKGDVIKIDGKVQQYQDTLQIGIIKIRKADDKEYVISDFFRTSRKPTEEIYSEALALIDSMKSGALKRLVQHFYLDDPQIVKKLKTHPAAKNIHHGYIGGLLEHMVSVCRICLGYTSLYPELDRDLLIAGALLHDIGKLEELESLPTGDYSDEGRFLGHITIGYLRVHAAGEHIADMDPKLLMQLDHMILSHHGEREYGSPVVPITMEAMALHLADLSDSKLKQVEETIEQDHTEGSWTGFNRTLERYFYKPEE